MFGILDDLSRRKLTHRDFRATTSAMNPSRRQFLKRVGSAGTAATLMIAGPQRAGGQGMSSRGVRPAPRPKFSGRRFPVTFTDVAGRAGLTQPVVYGQEYVKQYIFEANGP